MIAWWKTITTDFARGCTVTDIKIRPNTSIVKKINLSKTTKECVYDIESNNH